MKRKETRHDIFITVVDELLALRDADGVIRHEGDMRIECDVPYRVGRQISGLRVGGNLYVGGSLYVGGYLYVSGDLYVSGNLYVVGYLYMSGNLYVVGSLNVSGYLYVRGYLDVSGNLYVVGNLYVGGYLYVSGNLTVGGYLDVSGNHLIIMGDLFWGYAHKPALPEKTYIRRILPPSYQREHWQERLGIDLGDDDDCYEDTCPRVLEHIERLLSDTKWSTTERWMLETLRDSGDEPPAWVVEVRTTEPEAA